MNMSMREPMGRRRAGPSRGAVSFLLTSRFNAQSSDSRPDRAVCRHLLSSFKGVATGARGRRHERGPATSQGNSRARDQGADNQHEQRYGLGPGVSRNARCENRLPRTDSSRAAATIWPRSLMSRAQTSTQPDSSSTQVFRSIILPSVKRNA